MAKVLGTHFAELGASYIEYVRSQGVDVAAGTRLDASAGFHGRNATLYRYVSVKDGEPKWVVEIEGYDPPDSQWFASTVLDAVPSIDAIEALAGGQAVAAGDVLAGAD